MSHSVLGGPAPPNEGGLAQCVRCGQPFIIGTDHQCPTLKAVPMALPKEQLLALMTAAILPYYTNSGLEWVIEVDGAYHAAQLILDRVAKG